MADLFVLFQANNDSGQTLSATSADGVNWPGHQLNLSLNCWDTVVGFAGLLWAGIYDGEVLQICSSEFGVNWTPRSQIETGNSSASLCVWKGQLVVILGFPAALRISADGVTWSDAAPLGFNFQGSVSICEHSDGRLYAAFHHPDTDPADAAININVCSTADGAIWSAPAYTGHYWGGPGANYFGDRSIASFNGLLWIAYTANNDTQDVLVTNSSDGVHWSGDYQTGHQGKWANLTVFGGQLWIAYVTTNDTADLLMIHATDGYNWSGDINTGQQAGSSIRTFTSWDVVYPPPVIKTFPH